MGATVANNPIYKPSLLILLLGLFGD